MHCYIFVRKDLSWPQIAVQVGHVCAEFGKHLLTEHPNMVLIGIKSGPKLRSTEEYLREHGVRFVKYHDRSMDQDTAIATEPIGDDKRMLFAKYRLLKEEENDEQEAPRNR